LLPDSLAHQCLPELIVLENVEFGVSTTCRWIFFESRDLGLAGVKIWGGLKDTTVHTLKTVVYGFLPLTDFIPRVGFVDDVNAAFAADDAAVFVAVFQSFEGVSDFHKQLTL
jgi:hypothetical protein